jgi:hypothetical protein
MPVLARVYHVSPSEQHKLTLQQFRDIQDDYERVTAEEA